jgi:hypothetical protein
LVPEKAQSSSMTVEEEPGGKKARPENVPVSLPV